MNKQKVSIEYKYRGSVALPENRYAKDVFFRVKQAYANHETMSVKLIFNSHQLKKLTSYVRGGAQDELENLDLYLELAELLNFNAEDAIKLKNSILFLNDSAHSNFNVTKRIKLVNKKRKSKANGSYLFWDIENFSNVSSIFSDVIEPYDIEDCDIYLAANPDSLYLKRAEWEANLYDYGKTLKSFNFIKCGHGKDVADDVLLQEFQNLRLKNANVFMLTFDRELKDRFREDVDASNNLYVMAK